MSFPSVPSPPSPPSVSKAAPAPPPPPPSVPSPASARSKESIWQLRLNVVHQNVDDDTVFEQLTIRSVDEFINEIQNAIEILEKFQLSVFNQEPRHLIPIHIDQILKKDFLTLKLSNR